MDLINWMENYVNGKPEAYKIAICALSCQHHPQFPLSPSTLKHKTLPGFSSLLSLLTKFKTPCVLHRLHRVIRTLGLGHCSFICNILGLFFSSIIK